MRLKGLSWNVHRGQLLCITHSSRPRKPWAQCPPALLCSAWRRAFFHAAPRRKGSMARAHDTLSDCEDGLRWCRGAEKAPPLHLGNCLQFLSALRNVRDNMNINTASHIPHLELMSRTTMGARALQELVKSSGKRTFQTCQNSKET